MPLIESLEISKVSGHFSTLIFLNITNVHVIPPTTHKYTVEYSLVHHKVNVETEPLQSFKSVQYNLKCFIDIRKGTRGIFNSGLLPSDFLLLAIRTAFYI